MSSYARPVLVSLLALAACAGFDGTGDSPLDGSSSGGDEDGSGVDASVSGSGASVTSSTTGSGGGSASDASAADSGSANSASSSEGSGETGADEGASAETNDGEEAGDDDIPRRRVPAEWEAQAAVWLQWPQRWERDLEPGIARVVATILDHEDVEILVQDRRTRDAAETALMDDGGLSAEVIAGTPSDAGFRIRWHDIANDNAWMRDNGPRYVWVGDELRIQDWGFDAWGGAFGEDIPFGADDDVPIRVADLLELPLETVDLVHERGDLEFNGDDGVILNWSVIGDPQRNPGLTRERAREVMMAEFGVSRVVMIEGTPRGDFTGGHVDGIARFIDRDRVVVADCSTQSACQPGDVDDRIYDAAAEDLAAADFEVIRWPFPAAVEFQGQRFDTDYMNWLVGNGFVITVGFAHPEGDAEAARRLGEWFPGRSIYVIDMRDSWAAGGGVHCHTNDQPARP